MRDNYYKKRIDKYDVISFDIFDTLLTRTIDIPTDVFDLVGKQIQGSDFKEIRVKAEKMARSLNENGEVNIQDIYAQMPIELQKYLQLEMDKELEYTVPIKKMDEIFKYAVDRKKQVFIISDMYLPSSQIRKMLEICELPLENIKVYISNEIGVNKISGQLFEHVIKENCIDRKTMIHFGDSIKADILGAKKAGIHCGIVMRKNRIKRMLSR